MRPGIGRLAYARPTQRTESVQQTAEGCETAVLSIDPPPPTHHPSPRATFTGDEKGSVLDWVYCQIKPWKEREIQGTSFKWLKCLLSELQENVNRRNKRFFNQGPSASSIRIGRWHRPLKSHRIHKPTIPKCSFGTCYELPIWYIEKPSSSSTSKANHDWAATFSQQTTCLVDRYVWNAVP